MAKVIYIHPKSQMLMDEIIPISVPALMNQLPLPVVGKFEKEITEPVIKRADIILMDIHWYLTLPHAIRLSKKIKAANRNATIIAGGITATAFARQIIENSNIDYIVKGDAEGPLVWLIENLVRGKNTEGIPNLEHKEFSTGTTYCVTQEVLDSLNYDDLDFFPSLKKKIVDLHKRKGHQTFVTHPWFMSFRGCPISCENCLGSPEMQRRSFGRGVVRRSPEVLRNELSRLSEGDDFRYLNCVHDFLNLSPLEDCWKILNREYALDIYYEFARAPDEERLELLLKSFAGGCIMMPVDEYHSTSDIAGNVDHIVERIKQIQKAKNFRVKLTYSEVYSRASERYSEAVREIADKCRCPVSETSWWWSNAPIIARDGKEAEEEYSVYAQNQGKRYRLLNAAFRIGVKAHKYLPNVTTRAADFLFSKDRAGVSDDSVLGLFRSRRKESC